MPVSDHTRFTAGDCHYLARALHIQSDEQLPMHAFQTCYDSDIHAFVIVPPRLSGRKHPAALDFTGLTSLPHFCRCWSMTPRNITPPLTWRELTFGTPQFGSHTYRRAHKVAARLLEEYLPNIVTD